MAQRAYRNHVALKEKLKRLAKTQPVIGKSYSALATLLLDIALKNSGYLPKESYYGSPFEQAGRTYKDWIAQLKRAGVLAPFKDEDQESEKSDWIRFKPGPVTLPYVNKEKAHQEEMASMRDLHESEDRMLKKVARVADDVQDLKAQIHQINLLMAELKRLQAPPPNAAAQLRSDEIVDEINGIMTKAGLKSN
jgi:SepF-like predicted cell division protein (DUF552 family)